MVTGRNAVHEALKSGAAWITFWSPRGSGAAASGLSSPPAANAAIPVKEVDSRKLDQLCGPHHQGIAAVAACKEYAELEDLFAAGGTVRGTAVFCDL